MFSLATFVLGVLVTAGFAYWNRSSSQRALDKLPDEVVSAIKESDQEEMTLAEFEDLLHQRGFIPVHGGLITEKCPQCGEPVTQKPWGSVGDDRYVDDFAGVTMTCPSCGWTHSVHTA